MYFNDVMKIISDRALYISKKFNIPISQQITTNATLLNRDVIEYMKNTNFTFPNFY